MENFVDLCFGALSYCECSNRAERAGVVRGSEEGQQERGKLRTYSKGKPTRDKSERKLKEEKQS